MTKTDCFAYQRDRCSALKAVYCRQGDCGFYKTQSQAQSKLTPHEELAAYKAIGTIAEFRRLKAEHTEPWPYGKDGKSDE